MAAYLDDVIVFDSDPIACPDAPFSNACESITQRFHPRRFDWATPFPQRVYAETQKMSALVKMPMPKDVKQVRALMGGINYYRKFLPELSKKLRPIKSLLYKGVKFLLTPAMKKLVREILAELTTPPILVLPDWDAVADGSRPFHAYFGACIDGFGDALEQEQSDCSMEPITYISRATLDSERHWTPLDLEAGSIVWALKLLRGYLWGTKFPHILRPQDIGKNRHSGEP